MKLIKDIKEIEQLCERDGCVNLYEDTKNGIMNLIAIVNCDLDNSTKYEFYTVADNNTNIYYSAEQFERCSGLIPLINSMSLFSR